MNHQKLIPLEAMRGLAAIIVLIHHVLLGFAPYISGLLLKPGMPIVLLGNGISFYLMARLRSHSFLHYLALFYVGHILILEIRVIY